jgi:hypothetical protein
VFYPLSRRSERIKRLASGELEPPCYGSVWPVVWGVEVRTLRLPDSQDKIPEWVLNGAAEILSRRANEIASFHMSYERQSGGDTNKILGSVEYALTREMKRLRTMAEHLKPEKPQDFDEED